MKQLTFLFIYVFPLLVSAQTNAIFQELEGSWYRDSRQAPVYSRWQFADANTLRNRTFTLICKDTVELSRCVVRLDLNPARLTLQIDTVEQGRPQTFRLVRTTKDELFWENDDASGWPQRLGWIFYGPESLTFRADGVNTDYRLLPEKGGVSMGFRFQTGLSWGMLNAKSLHTQDADFTENYQARPGVEATFGVGFRGIHAPLNCYLELGWSRHQIGVSYNSSTQGITQTRTGYYTMSDLFFNILPEVMFGKNHQIAVQAGVYSTFNRQSNYQDTTSGDANNPVKPAFNFPRTGAFATTGLLMGVSYNLPWTAEGKLHTMVYCRGAVGIINGPYLRNLSIGIGVGIGK